jgi:hypothetical protein
MFARQTQAKSIRAAAKALPRIPLVRPWLSERWFVEVDEDRGFVTPEGRVYIETGHGDDFPARYTALLAEFYATEKREWLRKEAVGGPASLPSLGFAFFLLLNGNVSSTRPFSIPAKAQEEESLAPRVMSVVNAFSTTLGSRPIQAREMSRLSGNWILTETGRRLVQYITVVRPKQGFAQFFVADGREWDLSTAIGERVSERAEVSHELLDQALSDANHAYELARPILVARGMAYRPASGARNTTEAVLQAFERQVGDGGAQRPQP